LEERGQVLIENDTKTFPLARQMAELWRKCMVLVIGWADFQFLKNSSRYYYLLSNDTGISLAGCLPLEKNPGGGKMGIFYGFETMAV
jgi:hypothetical protein